MSIVAYGAITGMTVFGVMWLRALARLHRLEAERDRLWDQCHRTEVPSVPASLSLN